jgi:glycosyltransferase involved in cell wall biosynthesis
VDVHTFEPREPAAAQAGLEHLVARLRELAAEERAGEGEASAFALDHAAAAQALAGLDLESDRLVAFTGKLIVSKGVELLLAAWPLVLAHEPSARLVVVGFGAYREGLERLVAALAAGDLEAARAVAAAGRELEGGPAGELPQLAAFLDGLEGAERDRYVEAARTLAARVVFTGRLEHAELVDLLPAAEAQVVSSTFPEAFGMVAAEAAACGVLPVSAAHSGLAEVTRTLEPVVPAEAAPLLSFPVDETAVAALADRLVRWLEAPDALREATRTALVEIARDRYSWEGVARGVIAAAQGRLDELDPPRDPDA